MNDRDPLFLPEPLPAYDFEAERLEADAADMANDSAAVERLPSLFDICAGAMAAQAGVKEPK